VLGSRYAQENLKGDDYSLLIDALLLVFHQSYFSLLPALAYKIRDRSALLKGYIHLSSVLDSHAEVFRINGLVLLAAGRPAEAREYFRGALLATHSDEHVFMTRLQTLWSAMIDSGAYREALKMLMDIAPTITRQDLEEFGELVQETLDAALKTPQQT